MIKPTPAIAAASTIPAWATGPNEIPAVTCPALGAEDDAEGKALLISWAGLEEQVAAYRAEVEEAALGTPAAEVLDIEADAEVIFRAIYQHSTKGGVSRRTFSWFDSE
jgi:hypothetical protein